MHAAPSYRPVMPWQGEALGLRPTRCGSWRMRGCWPPGVLRGAPLHTCNVLHFYAVLTWLRSSSGADRALVICMRLQQEAGSIAASSGGVRRLLQAVKPDGGSEQSPASPGPLKARSRQAEWPMRTSYQDASRGDVDRWRGTPMLCGNTSMWPKVSRTSRHD